MRILCWAQTDVGQKRDHNEDSFLVAPELGLYVVADGMGGHAGGDQASQIAVSELHHAVANSGLAAQPGASPALGEEPPALSVLRLAAQNAGETIFDLAQSNPHLSGMGTTLTALLFHGGRVHLAHVGDSRAYLFRDGRIEQLSEDHSWIQEQVKAGLLTDEEARHSKFKHIITRSVGFEREVNVDVLSLPVLMGDCFLLCSDGLANYLEDHEIARLLTENYYGQAPKILVDLANARGGDDNITVILIYIANDSGPPLVQDLSAPDITLQPTDPGIPLATGEAPEAPASEAASEGPAEAQPTASHAEDEADPEADAPSRGRPEAPSRPTAPDPGTPETQIEDDTPEAGPAEESAGSGPEDPTA